MVEMFQETSLCMGEKKQSKTIIWAQILYIYNYKKEGPGRCELKNRLWRQQSPADSYSLILIK